MDTANKNIVRRLNNFLNLNRLDPSSSPHLQMPSQARFFLTTLNTLITLTIVSVRITGWKSTVSEWTKLWPTVNSIYIAHVQLHIKIEYTDAVANITQISLFIDAHLIVWKLFKAMNLGEFQTLWNMNDMQIEDLGKKWMCAVRKNSCKRHSEREKQVLDAINMRS